jgi:hypothetical protein
VGAARTRLLVSCSIKCGEALAGVGYGVAARNTFAEALEGFDAPAVSGGGGGGAEAAAGGAAFSATLVRSPAWLHRGLLLCAQAQLLRATGKEGEAVATMQALEGLEGWGVAAAAGGAAGGAAALASLPPLHAYALSQSCTLRGSSLLQAGRLPDALPLLEQALHACCRVAQAQGMEAVGKAVAAGAAAAAAGGGGGGGVRWGDLALASNLVAPQAFPEPVDVTVEAAVGLTEVIRRGPPAGAQPPSAISMDLLYAVIRAAPGVLGRPGGVLPAAVTTILDGARDAITASATKRVLHAAALRYGMGHVDPVAFRIGAGLSVA